MSRFPSPQINLAKILVSLWSQVAAEPIQLALPRETGINEPGASLKAWDFRWLRSQKSNVGRNVACAEQRSCPLHAQIQEVAGSLEPRFGLGTAMRRGTQIVPFTSSVSMRSVPMACSPPWI